MVLLDRSVEATGYRCYHDPNTGSVRLGTCYACGAALPGRCFPRCGWPAGQCLTAIVLCILVRLLYCTLNPSRPGR